VLGLIVCNRPSGTKTRSYRCFYAELGRPMTHRPGLSVLTEIFCKLWLTSLHGLRRQRGGATASAVVRCLLQQSKRTAAISEQAHSGSPQQLSKGRIDLATVSGNRTENDRTDGRTAKYTHSRKGEISKTTLSDSIVGTLGILFVQYECMELDTVRYYKQTS